MSDFIYNMLQGGEGSMQALYNVFGDGSLHGTMQAKSFVGANSATEMTQSQGSGPTAGEAVTAPEKPKQRVRARRGQATDPHSIAERVRETFLKSVFFFQEIKWI